MSLFSNPTMDRFVALCDKCTVALPTPTVTGRSLPWGWATFWTPGGRIDLCDRHDRSEKLQTLPMAYQGQDTGVNSSVAAQLGIPIDPGAVVAPETAMASQLPIDQ